MTIILSLSQAGNTLWASGPTGLYQVDGSTLQPVPQPEHHLHCSLAVERRLFVGGQPHGVAYSPDGGQAWQAAWLDGVETAILCFASDPRFEQTGVILAGSEGSGLLRSTDRGRRWSVCNFGLQDYTILALTWTAPPSTSTWPAWQIVFAATETGLYRSPNGGLGWRRCAGAEGCFETLAVGADFYVSGLVLAGSEESGLWRSVDGGRHFEPVPDAPQEINALAATSTGWFLSDAERLWRSPDGCTWTSLPDTQPALVFLADEQGVWIGGEDGISFINL